MPDWQVQLLEWRIHRMNIIDISIPLSEETLVWEGDKGISVLRVAKIGEDSDFNVSRIELGVHSGTHIDAPFHVFENGHTAQCTL